MPTIGERLDSAEQRLFVNRARELSIFRDWIAGGPPLLKVDGPGGIGKTALVRAFRREAVERGRQVVLVDAAEMGGTPDAFLAAVAPESPAHATEVLSDSGALLIVDTFERIFSLTPFLQEQFLPELSDEVRLVFAGRQPLGRPWAKWADLVWTVSLSRLEREEVDTYLHRRGIDDARTRDAVWAASHGHPLAVSLAADMAIELDIREFSERPEWHLSVRQLVEDLLRDIHETRLHRLLEAAACVREFDEPTLAAVSGDADLSAAFTQLCHLSIVRPAEHGLMLHDDIRQILVEDLRWRHSERYAELRSRALDYYRARAKEAPPEQLTWINLDRLFLSQEALVHARVFGVDDPSAFWVQTSLPSLEDLKTVFDGWVTLAAAAPEPPPPDELSWPFITIVRSIPGTHIPLVRNREGAPIGFGFFLPVARDSLALLPEGAVKRGIEEWVTGSGTVIEERSADSRIWYLSTIALSDESSMTAIPPLTRECFEQMTRDRGQYLVLTREPVYIALAEACGFYPVGEVEGDGGQPPWITYLMDVEAVGPEAFADGLASFDRPPRTFRGAALEREVEAILTNWNDLDALDRLPIAPWVLARREGERRAGEEIRDLVHACVHRLTEHGGDDREAARAIDLGYLQPQMNHDTAARQLSVSRATFYRLRRRGVEMLAAEMWRVLAAG